MEEALRKWLLAFSLVVRELVLALGDCVASKTDTLNNISVTTPQEVQNSEHILLGDQGQMSR